MSSSVDEGLRAIKQKNRLPQKVLDDRIKQGIQTKEKIFRIIAESEPIGKSSADLKKEASLSRDRIHTLCKEYMDVGLLYKTARYGKYRLTQKALDDPARKGFFFDSKIMKTLPRAEYLSAGNKFCKTSYIQGVLNNGADNESANDNDKLGLKLDANIKDKLSLFEFALNIGAIVTLEMLMGIKFASDCSEPNSKNKVAWDWIENVIHPNVILSRFARINEIKKKLKRNSTKEPYPFYDMDPKDIESLLQSFNDVFPQVYKKSQDILSGLQRGIDGIDSHRQYAKEMVERDKRMQVDDPKHIKCGGELIPEIKTTLDGVKVQQCAKCHRWVPMKKSKKTKAS